MAFWLVVGDRDGGKTRWLQRLCERERDCEGVLSVKVFRQDRHIGYDARCVGCGACVPLLRVHDVDVRLDASGVRPETAAMGGRRAPLRTAGAAGPEAAQGPIRVGRFTAVPGAFELVSVWLFRALEGSAYRLVIDEVGDLELRGGGFARVIPDLVAASFSRDVFVAVRKEHEQEVRERFGIPGAGRVVVPAPFG